MAEEQLVDAIISKHARTGVVVDTNVLLLYLVGRFDRSRITTFKNTNQYVDDDFRLAEVLIGSFARIIVTPNILTEVSNLAGQLGEPARSKLLEFVATDVGK